MSPVLIALAITLVVEVPIVALWYPKERARLAVTCAAVTLVTNLAMNTLLHGATSYTAYLLVGEIGAAVVEAAAYYFVSRDRDLGRALVASALANTASYGAGLLLF